MKNKTNFIATMNFNGDINGLTNYSMWNMWIKDRNIGLWTLLSSLGVQRATSSVIMDPNQYPDALSIGDSMSFAFVLFLMIVHVNENEMAVHENEMK